MPEVLTTEAVLIREITSDDADAAAVLSAELGYPASVEAMRERIDRVAGRTDHVVYVACRSEADVVGWIDVGITHHLQSGAYGEIGGLVVSSQIRSNGIGRQLVARAEQWVKEQGVRRIVVRSQIAREAAHRFYEREGYSRTKTSAVFSKVIA